MRFFGKMLPALVVLGGIVQAHAATGEFEQLRHRLLDGQPTTSIVDFSECKAPSQTKPIAAPALSSPIGGLVIKDFMIMPKPDTSIGYSDNHLTVMSDGTPVLEVVQYRVLPNETATVTVNRLAPNTYKRLSDPMTFDCPLGTGLRFAPKNGITPAVIGNE
jgi:hypothetical protein